MINVIRLTRLALMIAGTIMATFAGSIFLLRACGFEIGLGGYPTNLDQGIGWIIIAATLGLCVVADWRQT